MKLHTLPPPSIAIHKLTDTSLSIANISYSHSIQICKALGVKDWSVSNIAQINEHDIEHWVSIKPELIILGTGKQHSFLNQKLWVQLAQAGIGLECMNTAAAARTYNVLLDEGRDVLGAFIL